jgi:hypothetical protein
MPRPDLDYVPAESTPSPEEHSALAPLRPLADLERPWLGLESFREDTRAYFFGRDAEISELHLRLRSNPLLVLHGRSGLGKTSILLAGFIPRLRGEGRRPLLLRLSYGELAEDVCGQFISAVFGCGDSQSRPIPLKRSPAKSLVWMQRLSEKLKLSLPDDLASRLWIRLHYRDERPDITHLILDQFEEVFTLGARQAGTEEKVRDTLAIVLQGVTPEPISRLIDEHDSFSDHFDADSVPVRVILALRSDYVYALNRWRRHFPTLGQNNLELHALRGPAAFKAVFKPGELRCHYRGEVNEENRTETGLQPIITEETSKRIVRFVAQKGEDIPIEEIEAVPPILSLLCRELNERRFTEPGGASETPAQQITFRENEPDIGTIINAFYERCLAGRPEAVRIFIEEELVSPYSGARIQQDQRSILKVFADGCKIPGASDDRRAAGYGDPGAARACLEELVYQRLLTVVSGGENPAYEVVHDLLAGLVEKSRTAREERLEKERAERRAEQEKRAKEEAEARAMVERELRREQEARAAETERAHRLEAERTKEAEMRKRRVRKRRNIGYALGLLTLIITASAIYWLIYLPWRQEQPWCYLDDLATGRVHPLTGEFATVGGKWSTKDLHLKVKLLSEKISRIHLIILRDFTAFDVRSTNGTTINAEFLPYAKPRTLEKGDVIVVAGIVPFQLEMPIYRLLLPEPPPKAPPPPEGASGILIDGRGKAINYLRSRESFVSLDEQQRLIVEDVKTGTTLITIRIEPNGQITLEQGQSTSPLARTSLYMIWKKNEYEYPEMLVQPGQAEDATNVVFRFRRSDTDIPFQIVPIFPGLKLEE